jgi:ABC-type uncharacterized transport system permease subunit
MWLFALYQKTFLARAQFTDLFFSTFAITIQSIVALFFGIYLNVPQVFWYYLFTMGILSAINRSLPFREFEEWVSEGKVSQYLIRPVNFFLYVCVRNLASITWFILLNCSLLFLVYVLVVGLPVFSIDIFLRLLIATLVSIYYIYITTCIFLSINLFVEKITALTRVYFMIGVFLTGGFFPVLFKAAEYLPQFFMFGAPATFVTTGVILHPILWIAYLVLFTLIAVGAYYYSIKRLEVNGG